MSVPPPADEPRTLIDDLLAEQRQLTAVEKFSRAHDRHEVATPSYRDLIPLSAPAPGHQYAFEVDLDRCSGCKACVTACHSLNGLDDGETWREVGQLISDDWRRPMQQVVTTACHHCVDPGCLNGCPVLAYEKDPVTGIVRHLDDQCIGCSYCVLKCPYEVPKYSAKRGIVRKCDMCSQRLAAGEAPACVQACPNEAIRITVVSKVERENELRVEREGGSPAKLNSHLNPFSIPVWLPASPPPHITIPTTRYVSKQPLPADLIPADAAAARLQPAHWPLVWMLVLTQLSVGALALAPFVARPAQPWLALVALVISYAGLTASVFHLGKPLKAWRSFLGLRRSWLSREIVVFGLFAPLATMAVAGRWFPSQVPTIFQQWPLNAATFAGLAGVFCSGMIYHDTQRVFWRGARSVGKFFGTATVLGLAAAWLVTESTGGSGKQLVIGLALASAVKLAGENRLFRHAAADLADEAWPKNGNFDNWSLARSAVLMRDQLGLVTRGRIFTGLLGGVLLPLASLVNGDGVTLAATALALCFFGELAERYLFFRAVVPPRMPGGV